MEKTKYDSTKVLQLVKNKAKSRQIINLSEFAKEIGVKEQEIKDAISKSSIDIDKMNIKTKNYIDTHFKPILNHIQKNTENVEPVRIEDLAQLLGVSHAKIFLILKELNFDTLEFNRKIKKAYHDNILKEIKSFQKQKLLVDYNVKKLHEKVNYKYSLFTFGIFLQEAGIVLNKKVPLKESANSIKPFIDEKIKKDHEIRLVDIAKELGVTTQRASIILKQMNVDIKETNRKAKEEYHNELIKQINELKKKNLLESFSPKKLYVYLNYKFPFFNFNEMLKEHKIRLKFNMDYVDLEDLFKTKGIKTKSFTVQELYDLSGIKDQMQFNSFRVKVYGTKLPYKKKKA